MAAEARTLARAYEIVYNNNIYTVKAAEARDCARARARAIRSGRRRKEKNHKLERSFFFRFIVYAVIINDPKDMCSRVRHVLVCIYIYGGLAIQVSLPTRSY